MRCKACHYDLRGAAENRCPECGRAFDPADPTTLAAPWWSRPVPFDAALGCGLSMVPAAAFVAAFIWALWSLETEAPLSRLVPVAAGFALIPAVALGFVSVLAYGVITAVRELRSRRDRD